MCSELRVSSNAMPTFQSSPTQNLSWPCWETTTNGLAALGPIGFAVELANSAIAAALRRDFRPHHACFFR